MHPIDEKFHINNISKSILDRVFDKTFSFEGEAHDFWEIVYVVSGKIEVAENENIYILSEGDMIFHAPMEFHKICATDDTSPHVLNMSFTAVGDLPSKLKDGLFHLNTDEQSTYIKLFEFVKDNLIKTKSPAPYTAQEAAYRLAVFLLHLCHSTQMREAFSSTASALTYKALVHLMQQEVRNNLSVKDFAEKSFISISYIKLLFRHYAGISPKTYYNNLRILEAKHLLSFGYSVTETASRMNFSSPNNFVRFFKTYTSVTPYQYKKN